MHKLRSSSIGCEDFSITESIKNGVSVEGRPPSVMKVLSTSQSLGRIKYKVSSTIILSVTHISNTETSKVMHNLGPWSSNPQSAT